MRVRFPNGIEAEGAAAEIADLIVSIQERVKNGPMALPAPAAGPAAEAQAAHSERWCPRCDHEFSSAQALRIHQFGMG